MRTRHTILFNDQLLYSRWNVMHFSKTNDSYLNQEYSVLGNSSTFKYTCLFPDFCGLFSYHSQTEKLQHHLFDSFQFL